MSDQEAVVPEQLKVEDLQKQFELFGKAYQALAAMIELFPIDTMYKEKVHDRFDDGFLRAKEIFNILVYQSNQSPASPEPSAAAKALETEVAI